MKRGGILNPAINHLLASTGHTDYFTICDRGFPIPASQDRIDLALADDLPTVLDVIRLVDTEFVIDRIILAEEAESFSPGFVDELRAIRPDLRIETVPHLELKRLSSRGRATIRTGDTTPFANILVISG
ncbi:MAG TPA: D-ribose pyranase [Thermomicrobiales bacterium]|nr:D-ribose pyranase [Thermomicrobiales bacterium]